MLATLAACQDQPTQVSPTAATSSLQARIPGSPFGRFRPGEEYSVTLAQEVQGFGGFYIDDVGNLHAYLLDGSKQGPARAALAQILAARQRDYTETERRLRTRSEIVIHRGQFTFLQLADWRNLVENFTLTAPGVVWVGLDEHVNRVAMGVDRTRPAAVEALVIRRIAELGIPQDAITFEAADPISPPVSMCDVDTPDCQDPCTLNPDDPSCQQTDPCIVDPSSCPDPGTIYPEDPSYSFSPASATTLESPFERMFGGIRIMNPARWGSCTLGFPVLYQGQLAFITNSHCTPTTEYVDINSYFYQPDWNRTPAVAKEWIDPYKRSYGYRMADATIAQMINGYNAYVGYVARLSTRVYSTYATSGNITLVSGSSPWIKIIGEGVPVKDAIFDKVGATTGWTYGFARQVCVKYGGFECVSWVAASTYEGDSGSPVLRYYSNNTALLVGMVYAKENGGFWFNPISQIRKHFGATGSDASLLRTY